MKEPLESYANLAEFFARPLKDGVRPLGAGELVSPVDGRVSSFGKVEDITDIIHDVKGLKYQVDDLLAQKPNRKGYVSCLSVSSYLSSLSSFLYPYPFSILFSFFLPFFFCFFALFLCLSVCLNACVDLEPSSNAHYSMPQRSPIYGDLPCPW